MLLGGLVVCSAGTFAFGFVGQTNNKYTFVTACFILRLIEGAKGHRDASQRRLRTFAGFRGIPVPSPRLNNPSPVFAGLGAAACETASTAITALLYPDSISIMVGLTETVCGLGFMIGPVVGALRLLSPSVPASSPSSLSSAFTAFLTVAQSSKSAFATPA